MQKNLVIVESPAKAKTIEKFLGADYKVMSSYGHIRDLKKKNFGVDLATFTPQYEIPADKKHVVSELRAQAKKAETIWLASDEDREGEAISWHLAEVLGLDPQATRRIVFHEITQTAIQNAIAHPRHIDLHLVDAQQARRVLDRLVGFKLSPVLWRKVRPNLSAGRVQSVAVRLIVEREREIAAFEPAPYFRVTANFLTQGGQPVALPEAELNKRFETEAEVRDFLADCAEAAFNVTGTQTKPSTRTPAPPFTTSTLQQEAARKLGFPVALTMRVAQSLYEAGLITYMRTDSMNLSDFCKKSCEEVITQTMGPDYHKRRAYHTKAKGAQEAHEAIRPTDMHRTTISGTGQEKKLYELIRKRTLACQMADARLERTIVTVGVEGRTEQFNIEGEVVKFDGFLRVYRESRGDDDTAENLTDSQDSGLLPPISQGDRLSRLSIKSRERFTMAPPRYSEASLVHQLEELGIGRPSTYAPTISTIQQREYVRKGDSEGEPRQIRELTLDDNGQINDRLLSERTGSNKGRLVPTDTGTVVNDFLLDSFPDIMDYGFTATVEKQFDDVAEGKQNWTSVIGDFYSRFEPEVERTMNEKTTHRIGERELGTDPDSGKPVSVKIGRYGPLVQIGRPTDDEKPRFANLAPSQSIETITLDEALELFRLPRTLGEHEGQTVKANAGRFGPYVQIGKTYASIPKDEDVMTITLERAIQLLMEKQEAAAKTLIKAFDEEPELTIRNGRYGPYIAYKGKNYKLPKKEAAQAAELSLETCKAIVEAEPQKTKRRAAGKS